MKRVGIEIELVEPFNVVRETLERIGIANKKTKVLNPSCYLLHKRGKYYICHFKDLFLLDGKRVENYSDEDKTRRFTIAKKLEDWGLIKIIDKDLEVIEEQCYIYVLKYTDAVDWDIIHKYSIGTKK